MTCSNYICLKERFVALRLSNESYQFAKQNEQNEQSPLSWRSNSKIVQKLQKSEDRERTEKAFSLTKYSVSIRRNSELVTRTRKNRIFQHTPVVTILTKHFMSLCDPSICPHLIEIPNPVMVWSWDPPTSVL